jgi:hypothetical protein
LEAGASIQRILYDEFTEIRLADGTFTCETKTRLGHLRDRFSSSGYGAVHFRANADISALWKLVQAPRGTHRLELAVWDRLMGFRIGPDRLLLAAQRVKRKSE